MTTKNTEKRAARIVQVRTGLNYMSALRMCARPDVQARAGAILGQSPMLHRWEALASAAVEAVRK